MEGLMFYSSHCRCRSCQVQQKINGLRSCRSHLFVTGT